MLKWLFTRITIFDDPEDDEYDGDLCESDKDFPMIRLNLTLAPAGSAPHESQEHRVVEQVQHHEEQPPSHHESEDIKQVES